MTPEEERWAEALLALQEHGERVPAWIADRTAALAVAGDVAGVRRFLDIVDRIDRLMHGTTH